MVPEICLSYPMVYGEGEEFYKRKYRSPFVISCWGSWHSSLFTRGLFNYESILISFVTAKTKHMRTYIFMFNILSVFYRLKHIVFVSFLFSLGKAQFSRQVYYLNCSIFHLDYFIRKLCIFGIKS